MRSLRSRECGLYEASDLMLGDHLTEKSELARSDPDTTTFMKRVWYCHLFVTSRLARAASYSRCSVTNKLNIIETFVNCSLNTVHTTYILRKLHQRYNKQQRK